MASVNHTDPRRIAAAAALTLLLAVPAAFAWAQAPERRGGGQMSREDRSRLREDLGAARREVYKDPRERRGEHMQRDDRRFAPEDRRFSPEDRSRLRRDLEDANRGMPKRR